MSNPTKESTQAQSQFEGHGGLGMLRLAISGK